MKCIYTTKDPQWVLYHIHKLGGKGVVISSINDITPPSAWEDEITYILTSPPPKELPIWKGTLWVCGNKDTDTNYPNYTKDILQTCLGILDRDLCLWLLSLYEPYPKGMERLVLKLQVMAMVKGQALLIEDIQPLIPTYTSTPFLWAYQKTIGNAEGLKLLLNANNTDLWKTYMIDNGLMKYLISNRPELVYSLLEMREKVNRGNTTINTEALLWHINTLM